MALNKAQLMEVPGGPGIVGAVQAGSGISISQDGVISYSGYSGLVPPPGPTPGTLWYDTASSPATLKVWNGNEWVAIGQVTRIVAGSNITVTPPDGVGNVTINATGGGGGGGGLTGLQKLDDISSQFNGTQTVFPARIGGAVLPAGTSTSQLILFVGGAVQIPGSAFTFDSVASQIAFTGPPQPGRQFLGFVGGSADPILEVKAGTGLSGGGTSGVVTLNNAGVLSVNGETGNVTISSGFPAGTTMLFAQAAAPSGWVQVTSAAFNDASVRLVTSAGGGTGGSIAFSTLFSTSSTYSGGITITSGSVGNATLSVDQLASHKHGVSFNNTISGGGNGPRPGEGNENTSTAVGGNGAHTHTLVGAQANGNFTSNFAVKYVNVIVCTKS